MNLSFGVLLPDPIALARPPCRGDGAAGFPFTGKSGGSHQPSAKYVSGERERETAIILGEGEGERVSGQRSAWPRATPVKSLPLRPARRRLGPGKTIKRDKSGPKS